MNSLGIDCIFFRFQHHRTGAIAKQYAGTSVLPVCKMGKSFRTNYQCPAINLLSQIGLGCIQRQQKSCACTVQIKAGCVHCTDQFLHFACSTRHDSFRWHGRHQEQINLFRSHSCIWKSFLSRTSCHISNGLSTACNVSLTDSGSPTNPLITCIHHVGQFVIVPHLNRPVGTGSLYFSNHNTLQVCCVVSCF